VRHGLARTINLFGVLAVIYKPESADDIVRYVVKVAPANQSDELIRVVVRITPRDATNDVLRVRVGVGTIPQ
jgi:hypothetical protein